MSILLFASSGFAEQDHEQSREEVVQQGDVQIAKPTLRLSPYPKALGEKIYNKVFLQREYFPYERKILVEEGDVGSSSLFWKSDNLTARLLLNTVTLNFSTADIRFAQKNFDITLDYSDKSYLVIKHSDPRLSKHQHGLKITYDNSVGSNWGGVIYGRSTPGVVFFVGKDYRKDSLRPPLLICPRYITPKGDSFVIAGSQSSLTSMHTTPSGESTAYFRSGYANGDLQLSFKGIGAPESLSPMREVQAISPQLSLEYVPRDDLFEKVYFTKLPSQSDVSESNELPSIAQQFLEPKSLALSAVSQMKNSAGHMKYAQKSKVLWVNPFEHNPARRIDITRTHVKKYIQISKGLCTQLFFVDDVLLRYDRENEDQ